MARPHDPEAKARALEVYRAEGLAAAAKATGLPKSTIDRWAKVAGVTPGRTDPKTANAAAEAARKRPEARAKLEELIRHKLAFPAAERIAALLVEDEANRAIADEARQRWADALRTEAMAEDLEGEAGRAKAAKVTTARRRDWELALSACLRVETLVGIVTRGVHDAEVLAGAAPPEEGDDRTPVVVINVPRPNRSAPQEAPA